MTVHKIELEGTTYPLKYGYGALRNLGFAWGCKGVQSVAKKFEEAFAETGEDVSFAQADMLGDVVIAGVENAGTIIDLDREDVVQELLFSEDKLTYVMEAFTESFGKQEDLGKGKPRKKARKKASPKKN